MYLIDRGYYFPLTLLQNALILMWLEQDPKRLPKNTRHAQESSLNHPFTIQMTNVQKLTPNFAKKPQQANIPFHTPNNPIDLQKSPQKQFSQSLTTHPIDGEAARRMISTIRLTQVRTTEIKKECRPDCHCKACLSINLPPKNQIQNMKEVLWSGPLIIHPNTDKYRMEKVALTYQGLLDIPLDKNLTKIKYLIDKDLYVPVIKLTHGQAQTRLLPNRKEGILLFIQVLLGYLAVQESFWTKFLVNDEMQGLIYRKYSLKGEWERVTVTIRRGTLKQNTEEQRKFSTQCLWSSFKIMQWEMPHVVVKLWDGIWKVEYGLPINRLSEWLSAFLSLISIQ